MLDKISLRTLLGIVALSSLMMLGVRWAVKNGDNGLYAVVAVAVVLISTLSLFALAFVLLLPFGVIAALSRESRTPGESPFATDRLPEQLMPVQDPDRAM